MAARLGSGAATLQTLVRANRSNCHAIPILPGSGSRQPTLHTTAIWAGFANRPDRRRDRCASCKARRARQAFACCASGVLSPRAEAYARRRLRKPFPRRDGTWVNLEQRVRVPNFDGTIQTLDERLRHRSFPEALAASGGPARRRGPERSSPQSGCELKRLVRIGIERQPLG